MKINRWIVLALIALLVVGTMGLVSDCVFASTFGSALSQDCGPEVEEDDANENPDAEDSDVEECGQLEDGDANEADEASGQDQPDEAAPFGTGFTADDAQAIAENANPGAGTLAVEFDRAGGRDIWEVELDNGLDVQVDANSGAILLTEERDQLLT